MTMLNDSNTLSQTSSLLFKKFTVTLCESGTQYTSLHTKTHTDWKEFISAWLGAKLLKSPSNTQAGIIPIRDQDLVIMESELLDFCRKNLWRWPRITTPTLFVGSIADAHLGFLVLNCVASVKADFDVMAETPENQITTYDDVFSILSSLYSDTSSHDIYKMLLLISTAYYQWQRYPTEEHANIVRAVLDWLDDLQDPYTGLIPSVLVSPSKDTSFLLTHTYVSLSLACERAIKHPTRIIDQALHFLKEARQETDKINWADKHHIIIASSLLLFKLNHYTNHRENEIKTQMAWLSESIAGFVQDSIGQEILDNISVETFTNLACFIYQMMTDSHQIQSKSMVDVLPGHLAWRPHPTNKPTHHFERVIPTEPQAPMYVIRNQVARYNFALTFIKATDTVLDVGCGSGWGANYLSSHCAKMIGTDVDPNSLLAARNSYCHPNLHYVQSNDIAATFADQKFDVVTCFEVLEHVDKKLAKIILIGIQQLLSPKGKLIGTTPIVRGKSGNAQPRNPYHIYEYSAPELFQLLKEVFSHVEVHPIGTRGSLAFVVSKENAIIQNTDGLVEGAKAFYEDAKQFLKLNDPVWAFETALRSATLSPQHYKTWGLLCKAGIHISLQRSHRRRFMSALLWRKQLNHKVAKPNE